METNGSLGMASDHNFPDPVRDEPNFPVLVRDKEIAHCFLCVQLDCRIVEKTFMTKLATKGRLDLL